MAASLPLKDRTESRIYVWTRKATPKRTGIMTVIPPMTTSAMFQSMEIDSLLENIVLGVGTRKYARLSIVRWGTSRSTPVCGT